MSARVYPPFDGVVLARALRARLAHERARMLVLLEQIAHAWMLVQDTAAIRSHVRATLRIKPYVESFLGHA